MSTPSKKLKLSPLMIMAPAYQFDEEPQVNGVEINKRQFRTGLSDALRQPGPYTWQKVRDELSLPTGANLSKYKISRGLARYLAACKNACRVPIPQRRFRGARPYYNPKTLYKVGDEIVGSRLQIRSYLWVPRAGTHTSLFLREMIDGFPNIIISDDDCDPRLFTPSQTSDSIALVDLSTQSGDTRWADILGLPKQVHPAGSGIHRHQISDQIAYYSTLRHSTEHPGPFIQTEISEIEKTIPELIISIQSLLKANAAPKTLVFKCQDGIEQAPAFAFLYTIAWLYYHQGITLNDHQFNELKFLFCIQNGPHTTLNVIQELVESGKEKRRTPDPRHHIRAQEFLDHFYSFFTPTVKPKPRTDESIGTPATPGALSINIDLGTVQEHYRYARSHRFHLFKTKQLGLKGDAAKASILETFKDELEACKSHEALEAQIWKHRMSQEYQNKLAVGQGLFTRLFHWAGVKTSSERAYESMCQMAREEMESHTL